MPYLELDLLLEMVSGRLRRANERVVEFQGKHAIAELWGSGKPASSDMMSLDACKHLFTRRASCSVFSVCVEKRAWLVLCREIVSAKATFVAGLARVVTGQISAHSCFITRGSPAFGKGWRPLGLLA